MKKYSVLLMYPESMTDGKVQTYYAWVEAISVAECSLKARACAHFDNPEIKASDFELLLVIEGHNKRVW